MENEYIEVETAIDYLFESLGENKNKIGFFLNKYSFFSLPLYISKDEIILEKADELTKELFTDFLQKKYPLTPVFLFGVNVGVSHIHIMEEVELYKDKKYFWKSTDFYHNKIFSKIQPIKQIIGYYFTSNIDETTKAILKEKQAEIDHLTAENQQQADTIRQLEELEAGTPAEMIADSPAYDWQAMDKNIYPPELHLAIMIWEKYYDPNLADMSQFSTPKFNKISTSIGLTNKDLKARIRTILTPMLPKKRSNVLFTNLKSIEGLHLQDFNPPE